MRRRIAWAATLALLGATAPQAARAAATADPGAAARIAVRYLSADHVYLDAGLAEGVAVGDTLTVARDGRAIATLVVVHAADHSASCTVVLAAEPVRVGDAVAAARGRTAPAAPAPLPVPAAAPPPDAPLPQRAAGGAPWADVSGWAALEWLGYADRSPADLDYAQPTLRLHLRARRICGRDLAFTLRGRARRDDRPRAYGAVPAEEWSNRITVLSLGTESRDAAFGWQVGRLASSAIAAAGPVDGALAEARVGAGLRAGAFAGTLPDWRDTAPRASLQKYGVFLRAERGDWSARRWSAAIAATAEYHGADVSRQYLYFQGDVRAGARWSLYQSLELDYNGGWRRDAAGERVSLTNLHTVLGWRPGRLALGLSYDNRQNHRDWDNRSLPDSLFDDAYRQGARLNASVRAGAGWTVFGDAGWRAREGESGDATWSWGGGASGAGLPGGVRVTAQAHGFDGPWASGVNPSLHLQRFFGAGHALALSGGAYLYTPGAGQARRDSRWARAEATWRFAPRWRLTGQFERGWGDDLDGDRVLAETGVSF